MARTLVTSSLALCIAIKIAFITLELALVPLELAFAAMGKFVSGYGATLSTAVQQYSYSSHLNELRCFGKTSIRIFDLRKVGQDHELQFSQ